jgi:integrase
MRRRFSNQGLSEEVVQLLLEGTRNTTRSTYQSAWGNWVGWCRKRDLDPVSASVNSVLEYLTGLQAAKFSYSLINIHRSMLSSTLERWGTIPIGQLPYEKQLLKGVFNRNPPRPKYSNTWDVKVVASLLASLGPNYQLNLTQLSKKLATLLALATFLRVSELSSILRQSVSFSDSGVSFSLGRPRKAQRIGALRTISVGKLSDPLLCPVQCLGYYIFMTDVNRNENNNVLLLVGAIAPFKHVSSSSISRWIKSVLMEAGVESSFSAHSTRGAAASRAVTQGVPIDLVLATGDWAAESTFTRFYRRPTSSSNLSISQAVLSQHSSIH